MRPLWQDFCAEGRPESARKASHWWKTIQLPPLWQEICPEGQTERAWKDGKKTPQTLRVRLGMAGPVVRTPAKRQKWSKGTQLSPKPSTSQQQDRPVWDCHPRHHPPGTSYQDIHHHHHRFKGGHQHKWYQKWIGHTIQQMKKSLTWMKVLLSHIQSYWRRQSRGKGFDIVGNWVFVNYDCIINTSIT